MPPSQWQIQHAERSLTRIRPALEAVLGDGPEAAVFFQRLTEKMPTIFHLLHELYGSQYDFFYHLQNILLNTARMYQQRPADLKTLDKERLKNPNWFQSEQMLGAMGYVDLFAGDLKGVKAKIPYFKELGITYLHLMPLFNAPAENSDGGYAVSDFRQVNPALGTMEQLAALTREFRKNGISLVLDFVFNHTSDEHAWAQKALAGDPEFQDYYLMYPDRTLPDQYERMLRDIFPEQSPGSYTYRPEIDRWIWTTFQPFQWDLNYSNPAVFQAMLEEMLFLANQGIEILRLDAVAFIWKQMGTTCENLPEAHKIIRAFNALVSVAAPTMIFKSEAIVHPDDVASYISPEECPISYNPTMMALTWEALATRDVRLLSYAMQHRFALPEGCAWVNYVRCHDDIGWSFADEDAWQVGITPFQHRQFLNRFYTGQFEGSFAAGVPFNYNPVNQDMRICGMGASLAGLETAQKHGDTLGVENSLKRILLIHSLIVSAGGIPLLYIGDEIATLNDYSYKDDPAKADDGRWVHRPRFDWERAAHRKDTSTPEGRVYQGLKHLIGLRKSMSTFGSGHTAFFDSGNRHVLAYVCGDSLVALANFSESAQTIPASVVESRLSGAQGWQDLIANTAHAAGDLTLEPYQFVWLVAQQEKAPAKSRKKAKA
jgi:amylosucrase